MVTPSPRFDKPDRLHSNSAMFDRRWAVISDPRERRAKAAAGEPPAWHIL
ncbi:hypothetical protein N184_15465 [Sinorhizobium sp. GL28]|nr:hypothetical protein N184_15465 [Sinorhizobium sp. GL28]